MNEDQELKSLKRGLKAITLINRTGSITISELSRSLNLPRTTAERVLMTLLAEKFVERDPQSKRYFLTTRVRALSHGFGDEGWIAHVATPLLFETTRTIGWPLCIATAAGEYMSLRVTSDPVTSLRLHRRHIGSEIAMSIGSSGIMHLASLGDEERRIMLEILSQSSDPNQVYRQDPQRVVFAIAEAQAKGYSFGLDHGRERSVSVPIMAQGHITAVLLMVFMAAGLRNEQVVKDYVPRLKDMARDIERLAFEAEHSPLSV